jgi:hypothetical protein
MVLTIILKSRDIKPIKYDLYQRKAIRLYHPKICNFERVFVCCFKHIIYLVEIVIFLSISLFWHIHGHITYPSFFNGDGL